MNGPLVRPKPFWTDQNCFGHIEGQGINIIGTFIQTKQEWSFFAPNAKDKIKDCKEKLCKIAPKKCQIICENIHQNNHQKMNGHTFQVHKSYLAGSSELRN